MIELNKAISILTGLLFKSADRTEIDQIIKEVINLLEKHRKKIRKNEL